MLVADLFWIWVAWAVLSLVGLSNGRFPHRAAQLCEAVAKPLSSRNSDRVRRWHATVLVHEGIVLGEAGDLQRSVDVNEQVILAHGQSADPETRLQVAWAANNKCVALGRLGRVDEELDGYRSLTEGLPRDARFAPVLAKAWLNWAVALDKLHRHEEEKELYDRIQKLLENSQDASLDDLHAWSFVDKGIQLLDEHDNEGAMAQFDVVIKRWWSSVSIETPMSLHEALAAAGQNRCRALLNLERYEELVLEADGVVSRYIKTRSAGIEEEVAPILLLKGEAEEKLGRISDARRSCQTLDRRYARSQPELAAAAREALVHLSTVDGVT